MKFCIPFFTNFNYLDTIDEIVIKYKPKDTSLLEFLSGRRSQRVIIDIKPDEETLKNFEENIEDRVKFFSALQKQNPEINFVLRIPVNKEIYTPLTDAEVPFFFDTFVKDWDTLYGLMKLHPTDMYITENLGFELDKVAEILHNHNIKVRVFPNVAQSSWSQTPALKKFFIRPEDVEIYSEYVDIMELWGELSHINIYYKIYAIDKKWFGELSECIIGFNDKEFDSRHILPMFAEKRIKCGKKCFKGSKCQVCNYIQNLSKTLKDKGLILTKKDN